jgi:hypothetical protein
MLRLSNIPANTANAAIQALLTSGLRTIYSYTPPRKVLSWDPWKSEDDYFSDQTRTIFRTSLLRSLLVTAGYIWAMHSTTSTYQEVIRPYYADLRDPAKGKAKLITTHGTGGPVIGNGPSAVHILSKHNLLGPDILISHAIYPHEGDGELFAKSGGHFSSTPSTELQMGMPPIALQEDHYEHASLGIDCHSWTSPSIPTQMSLILQYARCKRQEKLAERGMWSRHTGFDVEQVFNLSTVGGAKAVGMEKDVGRLREGMKADLVVFDVASPAMLAAPEEDPVAAIVLHSSPGDIDMVLVDGVFRKENGQLVDVEVEAAPTVVERVIEAGTRVTWKDITGMVLGSRRALKRKMDRIDMKQGEEYVMRLFHLAKQGMLEA